MWEQIATQITQVTGENFSIKNRRSIGGGCINQGDHLIGQNHQYFVKTNRAVDLEMFIAEAKGLQAMAQTKTIKVPQPICWGTVENTAYLVLEWLDLGGRGNESAWEKMGAQLAHLHRYSESQQFGWEINNTIGSTPQINHWCENWIDFWVEHRINYQLKLGKKRGGNFPQGEHLLTKIPELLADHFPQPSLVHGDLWGGNASITSEGEPVIFDPATYWGDREVDLAMTELFGGFSPAFYRGYEQVFPLEKGYQRRKILYNLYHILNHFNLFGGSYQSQANQMISQLLKNH